jgi:uncharacterized small protein (DUF1192 family)
MFDFHERRKLKQYAYSIPTLIALFVVVGFLGNSVFGVYKKEKETGDRLNQRALYLDDLNERGEALESEIDRLSSERGLEEELRGKFEVAREGEEVIVIVNAPASEKETFIEEKGVLDNFIEVLIFWD